MHELERLTEDTYGTFMSSAKAALILGRSDCQYCLDLEPEVARLAQSVSDVTFRKAVLDYGRLKSLKKDLDKNLFNQRNRFKAPMPYYVPSAILLKEGAEVYRLESKEGAPITSEQIAESLKMNF
jgi:hypothetical protein